jgi:hypothetical protein
MEPREQHEQFAPTCCYLEVLRDDPNALVRISERPAVMAVTELGYPAHRIWQAYDAALYAGVKDPAANDLLEALWEQPGFSQGSGPAEDVLHTFPRILSTDGTTTEPISYSSDSEEEDTTPDRTVNLRRVQKGNAVLAELRRKLAALELQTKCRACLKNTATMANLPCGHLATCQDCVYKRSNCPACDKLIRGVVRVFTV